MSATREQPTTERGRLPVAPRDRRPALAALAILLILVGALGSALLVFRSGDRAEVLAAKGTIQFGQTVQASDFRVVRAAADSDAVISADLVDRLAGAKSVTRIPAGTLVNPGMFSVQSRDLIPEAGESVGIIIDPSQRPSQVPVAGDVVAIYQVSADSDAQLADEPVISAARVIDTGRGSGAGTTSITVLVRKAQAQRLTQLVAQGSVAVTLLPASTKPLIDIETGE